MSDAIVPILMPKWGLSMEEGMLAKWHVSEGATIASGDEIMDVETDKIANVVEAPDGGLLRRLVGEEGETYPVRALLGVLAPAEVSDAQIDAYIGEFKVEVSEDDAAEQGPAYEFADLDGVSVRYAEREGTGVPAVLIHGFGGDLDNWLFNIDAIAESRPVYALDLPGHGQSSKATDKASVEALASVVLAWMDKLGLERVHLVGHSMGGLIATQIALQHGSRVASLSLVCTAGLGDGLNQRYIRGFVDSTGRRDLKQAVIDLFADPALVTRALVDDLLKYKRVDGVQAFLEALSADLVAAGSGAAERVQGLASSELPLLIVHGERDAVIPVAEAHQVKRVTPVIIAEGGHMVQMEQASAVNAAILDHLSSSE